MKFQFEEDRMFFERLLCTDGESLENFSSMFDFRPLAVKKEEYNDRKDDLLKQMIEQGKKECFLSFHHVCNPNSGITLDHFIPLSTQELNKELRKMKPSGYKLVPSQSFGSNHVDNLILVCNECFHHRKHRFVRVAHHDH